MPVSDCTNDPDDYSLPQCPGPSAPVSPWFLLAIPAFFALYMLVNFLGTRLYDAR